MIANGLAQRKIEGREAWMQFFLAQVAGMPGDGELRQAYEAAAGDPIAQAEALTTFVIKTLNPTEHLSLIDHAKTIVQLLVPRERRETFFLQCRLRLMRSDLEVEDRQRRNKVADVYMESLQTVSQEVNDHLDARYASIQAKVQAWKQRQQSLTTGARLALQTIEQKMQGIQSRFVEEVDEMKRAQQQLASLEQMIGECEILLGGMV